MSELFDASTYLVHVPDPPPARTLGERQRDKISAGLHPLSSTARTGYLRLGSEGTCGTCVYRKPVPSSYRTRHFKCTYGAEINPANGHVVWAPRIAHSQQTDVRAWWSGCTDYEEADT